MYLLRRQIVFQTYGRWSGWNKSLMTWYLSRLWYAYDMYLLRRQIIFQTYGRWSGWNGWYLSRLWYVFT